MSSKFRWTIATKIFGLLSIAAFLPLLLFTGVTIAELQFLESSITDTTSKTTINMVREHTLQIINITENQLSGLIEEDLRTLQTLSYSMAKPLYENDNDTLNWLRVGLNKNNPLIGGIWVVNKSNKICSGSPHPYFKIGMDLSNDSVHKGILDLVAKNYTPPDFPPVVFNPYPVGAGNYGMGYDYPIFYNETFIGVVIITRDWQVFQDAITGTKIKDSGHLMLINEKGDIIAGYYSNESELYKGNFFTENPAFNSTHSILNFESGVLEGSINDQEVIFGFKWLDAINNTVPELQLSFLASRWAVVSVVTLVEFMEPVENIKADIQSQVLMFGLIGVVMFIISCLVGFVVSYYGTKRISDPIKALTNATWQISEGKVKVRVPITTNDEIADLAKAFNRMAISLSYMFKEREAMMQDDTFEE